MSFPKNLVTTYFLRVCNTIMERKKSKKKSKTLDTIFSQILGVSEKEFRKAREEQHD